MTYYYFEVETNDADYVDKLTGEIIKGFRRYGSSKEHRLHPIVEIGLFMDRECFKMTFPYNILKYTKRGKT